MDTHHVLYNVLSIAERVNLSVALFLNLALLYLIVRRSSKDIGYYRFLLFAFVLNDIYFTIIHAVTRPIICTYGDAFVIFATGFWSSQISISYYAATFSQTMPLLMHLFIYRFFAMKMRLFNRLEIEKSQSCRPLKITFYTRRNTAMLILGTLVTESNLWCWGSYFLYAPDLESVEYLKPFLVNEFSGFEYLAQLYWIGYDFRWWPATITFSFDIFLGSFLTVIIYCSFKIIKQFERKTANWSTLTRNLQRRLFHILIVQMAVPMLFVYLPCAGIISLPMTKLGLNVFPNLVPFLLTVFPMLDALIILFGVKSYRNAVFAAVLPKRVIEYSQN